MSEERREKRFPERDGVLFLIYNAGMVLLEERLRPDKPYFGYITIPGGKVDDDITHEMAARREVKEECGIEVKEMILLDNFLMTSITNQLFNVSAYLVTSYEGSVANLEGKSKHKWVDIDEAVKLVSFAETRYTLLLAKNYLSGKAQSEG